MGIALPTLSDTHLPLSHIPHSLAHREVVGKKLVPARRDAGSSGRLGRIRSHRVPQALESLARQGTLYSERLKRLGLLEGL